MQELYEAYADGIIQRESYIAKKKSIAQKEKEIEEKIREMEKNRAQRGDTGDLDKKLTEHMAGELVERIVIYPNGVIQITWRFQNEFEALGDAFASKSGE